MKRLFLIGMLFSGVAVAGSEFDFDWDDKNDMRGAWQACATKGFIGGDCPKVKVKCGQPPMIYHRRGKTKSYCVDSPKFGVSDSDKDRYLDEGSKRAKEMYGE